MNTILGNPEMMQKIMSLAQGLSGGSEPPPSPAPSPPPPALPGMDIDPAMLMQLSKLAGQSSIDSNQRSLLAALSPYLSPDRLHKLEKAMRAAKMAELASSLLGNSGFFPGKGGNHV